VLGIFGDNLQEMVSSSNFGKSFSQTASTQFSDDKTGNYADSQINVTIVAEQGLTEAEKLQKITIEMKTKIDEICAKGTLTNADQFNLAKFLTIYGLSAGTNIHNVSSTADSYYASKGKIAESYPITIMIYGANIFLTIVNEHPINWADAISETNGTVDRLGTIYNLYLSTYFAPPIK
jgi:hypothetical protein